MQSVFTSSATRRLIELAIAEDLALGDVASDSVFDAKHNSQAKIIAREALVVCGLPLIAEIIQADHAALKVSIEASEGQRVRNNDVLATVSGSTRDILRLERTMLNFLQRMCGVATQTHRWVSAAKGITILDTRKTLPGYRMLDKYATHTGGAKNHRLNLGTMAMIKNNHIDAHTGGLSAVTQLIRNCAPLATPIEIEVRDLTELAEAVEMTPAVIMLDNMSDAQIAKAFKMIYAKGSSSIIEVSGNISIERLAKLKKLGVTHVSIGALTHSVKAADISLRIM